MLSSLNNLSIRNKVTVAFAMVIFIMIGPGLFAVQRLREVNAIAAEVRDDLLPSSMMLGRVARLTDRVRANLGTLLLARDDRGRAEAEAALAKTDQELKAAWAAYEATTTPGEEHELAAAFSQAWNVYGPSARLRATCCATATRRTLRPCSSAQPTNG
jgi:methyl-accepting chemotaxis protein